MSVHNGTDWVDAAPVAVPNALALPDTVDPENIHGIRIVFTAPTAAIPSNAMTSVQLALSQRDTVTGIDPSATLSNTSTAQVSAGDQSSPIAEKPAEITLLKPTTAVEASKRFTPDEIAVSGATTESTVTLGAENTGTITLDSLTINEPSNPATSHTDPNNLLGPAFNGGGVTFQGFGSGSWPNGATEVQITYYFEDGTSEVVSSDVPDEFPAPTGTGRVTGFSMTFTGEIAAGAEAAVPFTVEAPPGLDAGDRYVTGTNQIGVSGTTPEGLPNPVPDTAEDDLTIFADQISIETEKSLTSTELYSVPGQTTTAQLKTTIQPYPRTTHPATQVIIDDPADMTAPLTPGTWYDHFNATAIPLTQVPGNATLTVQYLSAADGAFHDIPGMVDIPGPTVFTGAIPGAISEDAIGIRFIYTATSGGFEAGQVLVPNVTFTTRATYRTDGTPIPSQNDPAPGDLDVPLFTPENCSAAEAANSGLGLDSGRVEVEPPCPQVDLMPIDPTGVGPDIEKTWDPDLAFSRSLQNTTVNLDWNAGIQGIDEVVIADVAIDPNTGVPAQLGAASVFDTFNLTRIGPISDPLFAFDQVHIQLFNGTDWVDTSSCTAASPCSGASIPAIDLNTTEQATTQAVRFNVAESPTRSPESVTDPQPGTGVAVGSRQIPLTLQLRDTRRDGGDPVVAGPTYNTETPSQVLNTASVAGYVDDGLVHRDTDSDHIMIMDPELALETTKTWDGGPVAIPSPWTTPAPTSRVTIATTNQTAGLDPGIGGRVSEMRMIEPGHSQGSPDLKSPFEEFDLLRFHSLTAPAGTTSITFEFDGAGSPADITGLTSAAVLLQLQALPEAELRAVTEFTVTFTGNIPSGAANGGTGTVEFDLELRQFERSSPATPVTSRNVQNTVQGTVFDPRWDDENDEFYDDELSANSGDGMDIMPGVIDVRAGKSFNPTFQTEPDQSPITMTLTGQPLGSQRTQQLVLTDDRASFWNAYDFVGVASTLTLPVFSPSTNPARVAFSVCTGRTLTEAGVAAAPEAGCEATGGTWSDWSAPLDNTAARAWLPADPSAVQGIRMRITRPVAGDPTAPPVQWENPKSPTVSIPLRIERRDDLRTGGPVPSTLVDGGDPAPGETVKGSTTNTVRADVTGVWGGTANHSATAVVQYRHARNAVQVSKDPIGVKSPGVPFDYTLTVTNTGDHPVIDPIITDRLPWDATLGTLVRFDPDADPATRYAFASSGPASPTDPMPTDPADVTVVENITGPAPDDPDPTIQFTFPSDTVFVPGQTYTITFKMMFVAGVTEGQPVINGFDISGDRVWDACTAPAGRTATLEDGDTLCGTSAQVTPQRLPSIRGVKSVRAVNPAGGYNNHGFVDAAACTNRVNAESFAFQPCVPRTMPGQVEDWRLTVTNNGTTPLSRLVVADYLPRPGDTTLIAGFPRNSQWTPTLTGTAPTMSFAGGTLTSYVTTAPKASICMGGINSPTDAALAGCIDALGGDAEAATKFIPFANLTDLSAATALMFVIEPNGPGSIVPGDAISIDIETRTGAFSVQDATDPRAYNSLTVSARYPDGASTRTLAPRDQSNAGIALITGALRISKTVTGEGASFVPDDQVFSGTLHCTSQGVSIPDRNFTVTVDTPTVIDNLPAGAICTATETSASGQTSYTATTATVLEGNNPQTMPTIAIENVYELTELKVSKTVSTDAENFPSQFAFEVSCSFLGQPIELAPEDASFFLDNEEEKTITGLPVNAICEVTETNDRGADYVGVEAESVDENDDSWGSVTEDDENATAEIDRLAPDTGSNRADFTNYYGEFAGLRIDKALVGGAADLGETKTFDVDVVCTFASVTIYDETISLNAGNGWGQLIPTLVAGAECTITEPDLNGADAVVVTPNDGEATNTGTVTVPSGVTVPVAIEVTNRFLAGEITVTKSITGDGAELWGTGDFEVELVCELGGEPVRVIDGAVRTLNAENPTTTYTGIPSGATCTLAEIDNAGATESLLQIGDGEQVPADPGASFTVVVDPSDPSNADVVLDPAALENRFDLAEVSVAKTVVSDAVDQNGDPIAYGPFEVELSCEFNGEPITIPNGAVQVLQNGDTVTWDQLPAGALCSATETDTADADEVWYELPAADPLDPPVRVDGQVLEFAPLVPVGGDVANTADLFNAFESTALTIAKTLSGDGASQAAGKTFKVELVCTLTDETRPAGEEVWNETHSLSASTGWKAEVPHLATGADCQATEVDNGGASKSVLKVDNTVIGTIGGKFTANASSLTLTVDNTFVLPLVVTGGDMWSMGIAALLLITLGVAAIVLSGRRRRA